MAANGAVLTVPGLNLAVHCEVGADNNARSKSSNHRRTKGWGFDWDCDCEPDPSILDGLNEAEEIESAWFDIPWTANGRNGAHPIKGLIDSGSPYTMIRCLVIKMLGLRVHPLLKPEYLGGVGGSRLCIREFVDCEIECPLIGQGRVKIPIFVSHAREVKGLLIGRKAIHKFRINRKIEDSRDRHGDIPPGMTLTTMMPDIEVLAPIFAYRPKASKQKDREDNERGAPERRATMESILRAKGTGPISMPRSGSTSSTPGGTPSTHVVSLPHTPPSAATTAPSAIGPSSSTASSSAPTSPPPSISSSIPTNLSLPPASPLTALSSATGSSSPSRVSAVPTTSPIPAITLPSTSSPPSPTTATPPLPVASPPAASTPATIPPPPTTRSLPTASPSPPATPPPATVSSSTTPLAPPSSTVTTSPLTLPPHLRTSPLSQDPPSPPPTTSNYPSAEISQSRAPSATIPSRPPGSRSRSRLSQARNRLAHRWQALIKKRGNSITTPL